MNFPNKNNKSKIAIVFTGISYGAGRDFNHCFSNIYSQIIEPLKQVSDISIFLCTYENDKINELVELYKPKEYKILKFKGSHQVNTYIQSMESLLGQDFDFVVATRFDIHFNNKIDSFGIDFSKFNALFPEKDWYNRIKWWPVWRNSKYFHIIKTPFFAQLVSDNFFAFPYKMLEDFIFSLKEEYKKPTRRGLMDMHGVFNRMEKRVGKNYVNLVSKNEEKSDVNSFFNLCRIK